MMKARKLAHLWLALLLALGPVSSALAMAAFGAADAHHHNAVVLDVHDSAAQGDVSPPDTDHGTDYGTGHNHATCGVACMAALMSGHSSTTISSSATLYALLFIPVTGMVFPPHVRPPQAS
ncbi:MAG: hypothetical protein O2845_00025 [Proteobacteria bacterium]|nr:hypothetical protein [Pseudomonadota bacterium]